jgi:hypothetical protein
VRITQNDFVAVLVSFVVVDDETLPLTECELFKVGLSLLFVDDVISDDEVRLLLLLFKPLN